jgi:hypothetical protein
MFSMLVRLKSTALSDRAVLVNLMQPTSKRFCPASLWPRRRSNRRETAAELAGVPQIVLFACWIRAQIRSDRRLLNAESFRADVSKYDPLPLMSASRDRERVCDVGVDDIPGLARSYKEARKRLAQHLVPLSSLHTPLAMRSFFAAITLVSAVLAAPATGTKYCATPFQDTVRRKRPTYELPCSSCSS